MRHLTAMASRIPESGGPLRIGRSTVASALRLGPVDPLVAPPLIRRTFWGNTSDKFLRGEAGAGRFRVRSQRSPVAIAAWSRSKVLIGLGPAVLVKRRQRPPVLG